jgi:hypothetical protein
MIEPICGIQHILKCIFHYFFYVIYIVGGGLKEDQRLTAVKLAF